MTEQVKFGWVIPAQSKIDNSQRFVEQITDGITQIQNDYDSIWMPDHFHPPLPGGSDEADVLECMTTISYLAGMFPKLTFGNIVLGQSYRNPALVAKMGATLQTLTDGRFILGLGAGWKEDEYVAYGYSYPKASIRIAQLAEAVQVIDRLWRDTPANFAGEYYQITHAYCHPKPTPRPPIMIGGGGEKLTLRVTAQYADWWNNAFADKETCAHKLTVLQSHCNDVGRDYEEIIKTWRHYIAIAETEAEAKAFAGTETKALIGTPEQIANQLQPFIELDISHFMVSFMDFPDMSGAKLFAEQVVPYLKAR